MIGRCLSMRCIHVVITSRLVHTLVVTRVYLTYEDANEDKQIRPDGSLQAAES